MIDAMQSRIESFELDEDGLELLGNEDEDEMYSVFDR